MPLLDYLNKGNNNFTTAVVDETNPHGYINDLIEKWELGEKGGQYSMRARPEYVGGPSSILEAVTGIGKAGSLIPAVTKGGKKTLKTMTDMLKSEGKLSTDKLEEMHGLDDLFKGQKADELRKLNLGAGMQEHKKLSDTESLLDMLMNYIKYGG